MNSPSIDSLRQALADAGSAHFEFEQQILNGVWDTKWAGWYAAYVLGRLGDVVAPSVLTRWLEEVPLVGDWTESAAQLVHRNLAGS